MYELKKSGKVFTSKYFGTGPSSYEKIVYRAAVSQRLRNTGIGLCFPSDIFFRISLRQICLQFSSPQIYATCPALLVLLYFITRMLSDEIKKKEHYTFIAKFEFRPNRTWKLTSVQKRSPRHVVEDEEFLAVVSEIY